MKELTIFIIKWNLFIYSLKLNDIEDQFRELTNKFEEVNFKLDKLSTRVTKIQSDTQLRFSDLENDPNETFNLYDNKNYSSVRSMLYKKLVNQMMENIDKSPAPKRLA